MSRIGIDFGTTKTMVSWYNPSTGLIEVLKLGREGNSAIPTSILHDPNGNTFFGDEAEDNFAIDPEGYYSAFKLKLGMSHHVLSRTVGNGERHNFTAEDLTGLYLWHIKDRVTKTDASLNNIESCTLTVPVTGGAGTAWRASLERAARVAGFKDIIFLEEPVAAGRAYLRDVQGKAISRALIVDWGGGTLDVSVVYRDADGSIRADARSCRGVNNVGGEEMDVLLVSHMLKAWKKEFGVAACSANDIIKKRKFRREAKSTKEKLSNKEACSIRLVPPKGISIKRDEFNVLIEQLVKNAIDLTKRVVDTYRKEHELPDAIILVGGTCRIPYIKERFEQEFPDMKVETWEAAKEAVVRGALDMPVWVPGTAHDKNPNVIAGDTRGYWMPRPGYVWQDKDRFLVKWTSGIPHPAIPHLVSAKTEGVWEAEIGYELKNGVRPFEGAVWKPGKYHPGVPRVHTASEEGYWTCDDGYEFISEKNPFAGTQKISGSTVVTQDDVNKAFEGVSSPGYLYIGPSTIPAGKRLNARKGMGVSEADLDMLALYDSCALFGAGDAGFVIVPTGMYVRENQLWRRNPKFYRWDEINTVCVCNSRLKINEIEMLVYADKQCEVEAAVKRLVYIALQKAKSRAQRPVYVGVAASGVSQHVYKCSSSVTSPIPHGGAAENKVASTSCRIADGRKIPCERQKSDNSHVSPAGSFRLVVEDVAECRLGPVVTGVVKGGNVEIGQRVNVLRREMWYDTADVLGIERDGNMVDCGHVGESVGLLLRPKLRKSDLAAGLVLRAMETLGS